MAWSPFRATEHVHVACVLRRSKRPVVLRRECRRDTHRSFVLRLCEIPQLRSPLLVRVKGVQVVDECKREQK